MLYDNEGYDFSVPYQFAVGQMVYVYVNGMYVKATIIQDLGYGNFIIRYCDASVCGADGSDDTFNVMNSSMFLVYLVC
jgi:NADH:ubiquinone oxidoreductase subunit E